MSLIGADRGLFWGKRPKAKPLSSFLSTYHVSLKVHAFRSHLCAKILYWNLPFSTWLQLPVDWVKAMLSSLNLFGSMNDKLFSSLTFSGNWHFYVVVYVLRVLQLDRVRLRQRHVGRHLRRGEERQNKVKNQVSQMNSQQIIIQIKMSDFKL